MIDPALFASVPFGSKTALTDFAGTLELYNRALADHIFALTGEPIILNPVGTPGGFQWLQAIQATMQSASTALGVGAPPDLASFDLSEESDHASFFFSLAQEYRVLRNAAGLA
jgi:hypothetical protein